MWSQLDMKAIQNRFRIARDRDELLSTYSAFAWCVTGQKIGPKLLEQSFMKLVELGDYHPGHRRVILSHLLWLSHYEKAPW